MKISNDQKNNNELYFDQNNQKSKKMNFQDNKNLNRLTKSIETNDGFNDMNEFNEIELSYEFKNGNGKNFDYNNKLHSNAYKSNDIDVNKSINVLNSIDLTKSNFGNKNDMKYNQNNDSQILDSLRTKNRNNNEIDDKILSVVEENAKKHNYDGKTQNNVIL